MNKPRILYISSANPLKGPGTIALSNYHALKEEGFDVDLLTLYPVEGYPEFIYVKQGISIIDKLKNRLKSIIYPKPQKGYHFFYRKENQPPVSTKKILAKISRQYDLVMVLFWQGMLSFETIEAIYDKLHCLFFFLGVDYSQMSGGCHFVGDCTRYQIGCGKCPAFNSQDENDFTHWNVEYRKKVYEKVKPIVWGNHYMIDFYKKSYLLKNARLELATPAVDSETFHPVDKSYLRTKYQIPIDKQFIIAFGCQHLADKRKGIDYLIEALRLFNNNISAEERKHIMTLSIGSEFDLIKDQIPFETKHLGVIPVDILSDFYSLADIFVCPSVDDAGPTMVNQSLSCGTPVVGFEMGAVIESVKDKNTGYCAKLRDSIDLCKGIESFFSMKEIERKQVSGKCRDVVVNDYSYENKIYNSWMRVYDCYSKSSDLNCRPH